MGNVKQIETKNIILDMINLKHLDSNSLKIDKNTKGLKFTTLDTLQLKKLMIVKIFAV